MVSGEKSTYEHVSYPLCLCPLRALCVEKKEHSYPPNRRNQEKNEPMSTFKILCVSVPSVPSVLK